MSGVSSGGPTSLSIAGGTYSFYDEAGGLTTGYFSYTEIAAAVPEASTWAMMILGFASVGFLTYRRRNRAATLTMA